MNSSGTHHRGVDGRKSRKMALAAVSATRRKWKLWRRATVRQLQSAKINYLENAAALKKTLAQNLTHVISTWLTSPRWFLTSPRWFLLREVQHGGCSDEPGKDRGGVPQRALKAVPDRLDVLVGLPVVIFKTLDGRVAHAAIRLSIHSSSPRVGDSAHLSHGPHFRSPPALMPWLVKVKRVRLDVLTSPP